MAEARDGDGERGAGGTARGAAVAVVGGSPLARRLAQAQRTPRMERREIRRVLARVDRELEELGPVGEPHVTLSARVPWVADRGHVELTAPRSVDPADPNATFYSPEAGGSDDGEVEVWLHGLEPGASYFAQLRVNAIPFLKGPLGQWTVSGSLGPTVTVEAIVPAQTLPVVLHAVAGTQAVIRLRATGVGAWSFYDVEVSKLE